MKPIILLSLSLLFLFSCGGKQTSQVVKEEVVKHESRNNESEVLLTAEQVELAEIKATEMAKANLSNTIMLNGVVVTPPNGTVRISLPYAGIIKRILVAPNAKVQAGQPLLEIIGNDFIMLQENYISAVAAVQVAQKELDRQEQLMREDATTSKIVEQTRAVFTNAKARLAAAKASLESVGLSASSLTGGTVAASIVVKAPISGVVNMGVIHAGDSVEPGAGLLTVVSKSKLQLQLSAYEKDMNSIKVGDKVEFKLVNGVDFSHKGVVSSIGSVVDPATRVVQVMADITGDVSSLAVGMYTVAKVKDEVKSTYVMPENGVIADGGKRYIYAMEGTTFTPYEVITGIEDSNMIEILNHEALPANAKFVTYGAYYIRSQQDKEE